MPKRDAIAATHDPLLAELAHELRTPLTAIIGFAEAMVGEPLGPIENPKHMEYLKIILHSARHALSLVDDLQQLDRPGDTVKQLGLVDVGSVAEICVATMQPLALARSIALQFNGKAGLPPVLASERALKQVMFNLLSNALKFSDPRGHVSVEVTDERRNIKILVSDQGRGMDAATLSHVARGEPVANGPGGAPPTGRLGLAVSRALVEGFDGRLEFESAPGSGTRAIVLIPVNRR